MHPRLVTIDIETTMSNPSSEAEWYYVGQYGELGPLNLDQMKDLIQDKVVTSETYVWKQGMSDWVPAGQVSDLRGRIIAETTSPPPRPTSPPPAPVGTSAPVIPAAPTAGPISHTAYDWNRIEASLPRSDKNRVTAGLLNLIPGVGRFYLGYSAHGALQLITFLLCGVGLIWSVIDGIYILLGGVKYDGYGRVLND